jgi:hypothetical protein
MEQNPSQETNNLSVNYNISRPFWSPKAHYQGPDFDDLKISEKLSIKDRKIFKKMT